MNVEAAEFRRGEHRGRKDEPIGGDDRDVRVEGAELGLRFDGAQRDGRHDGQRMGFGEPMNRRLGDFEPTPARRPRRARVHGDDFMALRDDGAQSRRREFGAPMKMTRMAGAYHRAPEASKDATPLCATPRAVYLRPIRRRDASIDATRPRAR